MRITPLAIPEVLLVEPRVFADQRGSFAEVYNRRAFAAAGIDRDWVQDNSSRSLRGVLRGLHYQLAHPQAKLVHCSSGAVFDVAVDVRRGSPTFGRWVGEWLSDANRRAMFIPEGFAHGFLVGSDGADFHYLCSDFYAPEDERGIAWDCPGIADDWPLAGMAPVLSERDRRHAPLARVPVADLPAHGERSGGGVTGA